jgi:endonuclease YncB( thermonuclease family)
MSETSYLVITGRTLLVGKQPDGDSVRFVPDDPSLLGRLQHGERVDVSGDGGVQLRFDGIDAPEVHYQGLAQPLGTRARDLLLERLGHTGVTFGADGATVVSAEPATVPIVVLAQLVEVNGRPVSVVFSGAAAEALRASAGQRVELSDALLERSVNLWEAAEGVVYPLLYTSTSAALQAVFRSAARAARSEERGVWAQDATPSFPVTTPAALGPGGVLIWPKLFRRAVDHLHRRSPGQTLPEWLAATPLQDDDLIVPSGDQDAGPVPLHLLLRQVGQQVDLLVDVIEVTVVER